jgi:hypothetical protein
VLDDDGGEDCDGNGEEEEEEEERERGGEKGSAAVSDHEDDDDEAVIHRAYYPVVKFGQLNSCFRTDMPGDELVHGLAFANVTFRKAKENKKRRHYFIAKADANIDLARLRTQQKFVSINFIDSTSIGISVLSAGNHRNGAQHKTLKPMLKPTGVQSFIQYTDASRQSSGSYAKQDAKMDEIYLIELHPERVSYTYDIIDPDKDGTKLWEKVL